MAEWIIYACISALLTGLMPSFLKTGAKKAAPALGAYEDHAVSLNGVPGWYFLSAEKYWK